MKTAVIILIILTMDLAMTEAQGHRTIGVSMALIVQIVALVRQVSLCKSLPASLLPPQSK